MPNIKSAKKELRKNIKRQAANNVVKAAVKKMVKKNLKAIGAKEAKVKDELKNTMAAIDKMVKRGLIKKNAASRQKSHLQKQVNQIK
jgi:small subunit ribosomal protein S20